MERYQLDGLCVSRGAAGSRLLTGETTIETLGVPVQVADTVGAGDAFTAALIYGWVSKWPLKAIGRLANEVGAAVASQPGAMPACRDEFSEIISNIRESYGLD